MSEVKNILVEMLKTKSKAEVSRRTGLNLSTIYKIVVIGVKPQQKTIARMTEFLATGKKMPKVAGDITKIDRSYFGVLHMGLRPRKRKIQWDGIDPISLNSRDLKRVCKE